MVGQRGDVALHGLELLAHVLRPFDAFGARRRRRSPPGRSRPGFPAPWRSDRPCGRSRSGCRNSAWPGRCARRPAGSKISWLMMSMSPPARSRMSALRSITASSNSISTISPVIPAATGARQLVFHQQERPRLVIAHGHQAMAGEDEGHRRGARIIGVGRAHQRRRHVARAVLDIEPAGNLDFLHVLPGRHRDPGQPLHRLVLGPGSA